VLDVLGRNRLDAHLEAEVADDRNKIAVTCALAVAVDCALDLHGTAFDPSDRVGHAAPRVIVQMHTDTDVATEVVDNLVDGLANL